VFDGQIFVVLVLFSFCRVSESGGKGLVVASPAFMAVSMIVSNRLVVLVACLMILVISPSTVVFLALILLSSKLRDNDGASVATGCGSNSKDNKVELSYSMLSLPPTFVAMPSPGWNIGTVSGGRVHDNSGRRVRFCCVICGCISGGALPQTAAF